MPSYKGMKKETVLAAIKNSQGLFSTIAKRLGGCSQHTAEHLVHRWKETEEAYESELNFVLDLAESKVFSAIDKGDMKTVRWFLSTKGKSRGYDNTPVIKMDNGSPLNISLEGVGAMDREDLLKAQNVIVGGMNGPEGTNEPGTE